jgi:DNA-binding Xre family transcriptional regulator
MHSVVRPMKTIRNNLMLLAAQKGHIERRRITLRTIADETGINRHTLYAIGNDTIKHYPKDALITLCAYFSCDLPDLLTLIDAPLDTPPTEPQLQ